MRFPCCNSGGFLVFDDDRGLAVIVLLACAFHLVFPNCQPSQAGYPMQRLT